MVQSTITHTHTHTRLYSQFLPIEKKCLRGKVAENFGSRIRIGRLGELYSTLRHWQNGSCEVCQFCLNSCLYEWRYLKEQRACCLKLGPFLPLPSHSLPSPPFPFSFSSSSSFPTSFPSSSSFWNRVSAYPWLSRLLSDSEICLLLYPEGYN